LIEAAQRAGLTEVVLVPKPLAAAIGAGLDVASPYAQIIIEVGAGITEVAIVRSGELIQTHALRLACSDLHRAISQNVAGRYGILLFPREAERLIQEVGTINQSDQEREFITTGTDLLSGRSVCLSVTNFDVLFAVESIVEDIVDNITSFIERLSPDLSCEIIESGICLAGGGALLNGFAERLSLSTQLDVMIAHDPMRVVINGAKEMLSISKKTGIWQNSQDPV
jgi:rod shape-determining protein MreB and related proteins